MKFKIRNIYQMIVPQYMRYYLGIKRKKEYFTYLRSTQANPNSLQVFEQCKCIFVHIPKTAGLSIVRSLFQDLPGHTHRSALLYRYIFGKTYNQMFKFAFVRNPWARTLSAYNYLKEGGRAEKDKAFKAEVLVQFTDFTDFVIHWLTKKNCNKCVHFIPQYRWLCDLRGKLIVDFVGRIEQIDTDYEYIRARVGFGDELIHINKSQNVDYHQFYTEETRAIVEKVYKKEITLFRYSF